MTNQNTPIEPRKIDRAQQEHAPEQVQELYDEWADTYNTELTDLGYVAPQVAVAELHKHLDSTQSRILDAGCGTGLVGQALRRRDYSNLHGIDFSAEMLAKAADTGYYQKLTQVDMTKPIPLESAHFDAIISVGAVGRVIPPTVLDEFRRLLIPGGVLTFTVRYNHFEPYGYAAKVEQLERDGLVTIATQEQRAYLGEERIPAIYCTLITLSPSAPDS